MSRLLLTKVRSPDYGPFDKEKWYFDSKGEQGHWRRCLHQSMGRSSMPDPYENPLESPPATLPSQNKFHWEGKPLGNLTRLDQRQLLKMESSGTFAAISFLKLLLSGGNEDSRQKWEARRTKGKVGIVSGTDGCPWLPCALLAASSAPVPAGGIICGESWKGTHVSGHCPGQMEGGLRTRREPCMAGRVATIPLGSK